MRTPEKPLSVLHLEDSATDADLTASYLARGGLRAALTRADTREGFLRGLEAGPDLILADYALPSFTGLEALELARARLPETPFLFLSGVLGEDVAIETLRLGATDYVVKHRLERLVPAVRRALAEAGERAERRRTEALLRDQLRLTDLLARHAAEALFLTDRDGHVTFLNPAAERLLGWSLPELAGRRLLDILRPPDRPACHAWARNREDVFLRKDGLPVHVLYSHAPVREESEGDDHGGGGVLVITDISDRKHMEQELRRRADALAENDRRKDEFLAMLAHELRNPLAPITQAAGILKRLRPDDAELRGPCALIERQVRHLVRLVDDLLDVSRITAGKIGLRPERMDLAAAVARAVETSRPLLDAREHHLTVDLPPEPILLDGDLTRLAQALNNLLNNAAKYTPPRGRIGLAVARDGGEAVVTVRDDGIGITAEVLPHVFDLFTQGSRGLDRSEGGLGIGLTLVRTLARLHGGSVTASSEGPGRGSEFVLRLPVLPPDAAGPAEPAGEPAAETPPPEAGKAAARRILIVDDRADNLESLALVLRLGGHEVQTAADGPAALRTAREFRPDVILLDLGLPGMSGYEVARRLREDPATAGPFIAAMTGYGMDEDRRRSREAGMDAHLVKPIDPARLEALLALPGCAGRPGA